jgi:hypothetical protein
MKLRTLIALSGILLASLAQAQTWNRLPGQGLSGLAEVVTAFGEYNNRLIVTGGFTQIGGLQTRAIASYDGVNWDSLSGGLSGGAYSLLVHQNKLYAGGGFWNASGLPNTAKLAWWNGTGWSGIGPNSPATIYDIQSYQGDVYAVGTFTELFGVSNLNFICRWDGTQIHPLGGGLIGGTTIGMSLTTYKGKLIAGGRFSHAGNAFTPASNLAAWDGTQWEAVGGGTNLYVEVLFTDTVNDYLYVGGGFTWVGGSTAAS